ncbi:MAG: cysteine--tRNA ligase [Deinococcales bacterium]
MPLQFYNTLSRQKEVFKPVTEGHAGIYFCGPTVYSDPHLGHARGPIVFDILRRWLEVSGYKVRLITNVTDVGHLTDDADEGEDKLLKRAALEKLEPMEIAEKYFWAYFDAMQKLGVRRPSIIPKATGHIMEQIEMTEELLSRGLAYEVNGSVYFDVSKWAAYGELSGRKYDEVVEGTRVEVRSEKDDPRDFALWKKAEPSHLMRWNSPWGEGFPGWHIECSVMSTKYLGDEFDIHGGGLDLIFPHHECEIAQAKAVGKAFARYWLHWNFITLSGEKMAKSKGHFKTLAELFDLYDPLVVRFNILGAHYRSVSDFSPEGLLASQQGLKRLRDSYQELVRKLAGKEAEADGASFASYRERFAEAMNDDLNTPQALAVLFEAIKDINSRLDKADASYLVGAKDFLESYVGDILGVLHGHSQSLDNQDELLDGLVSMISEERQAARLRRDFKSADNLRDRLKALGISLEDTAEGTRWKRG